ncbi:MAG: glycosyltransferase family 4 protein [Spongiibacteraceae bacterium]
MAIKNIIIYSPRLPPESVGGMETNGYFLIRYLMKLNKYNIRVITVSNNSFFFNREKIVKFSEVEVKLDLLKKKHTKMLTPLLRVFKNTGFNPAETLIYHNTLDLHAFFYDFKKAGFLQVARSGGNDIFYKSKNKENDFLVGLNHLDRLILNSEYSAKRSASIGLKSCLLEVIKGGCEINGKELSSQESLVDLPENTPIILACGRLVDFKGIEDALDALAIVHAKKINFSYVVVGDGVLKKQLQNKAKQLGLQANCYFLGKLNPEFLPQVYSRALIYLSSSKDIIRRSQGYSYVHTETMGRSICEAQAHGVPVVSTDAGGAPEMIVDGRTGMIVEQGNITAMAKAVEFLLTNESVRQQFSREARLLAEDKFSWNVVFEKTIDLVEQIDLLRRP